MKNSVSRFLLLFCCLSLIVSGCAPTSTPVPLTFTTSPLSPTFTPEPTETAVPSPTASFMTVNGQTILSANSKIVPGNVKQVRQLLDLGLGDAVAMIYSPDDSLLAILFAGGWIRVFDIQKNVEVQRIDTEFKLNLEFLSFGSRCHACSSISISPDNKLIAIAATDGRIGVWEIADGEKVTSIPSIQLDSSDRGQYHEIYVTFISDKLLGVAQDGIVREIFDLEKGTVTDAVWPHIAYAWGHVTSSNLNYTVGLLYGSIVNNHTTDWQTWEQTRFKQSASNPVAVSPDGNFILNQSLQVWNIAKVSAFNLTAPIRIGPLERNASYYGLFSDQSDLLVALVGYGNVNLQYVFDPPTMLEMEVWDTQLAEQLLSIQLPMPKHNAFALSHSGNSFAYIDPDQDIVILNTKTGEKQVTVSLGDACLNSSTIITPDGTRFVNFFGNVIHICNSTTGELLHSINVPTMLVMDIAISPDGRLLASSGYSNRTLENFKDIYDSNVYIWDMETGAMVQTLKGHTGNVSTVAFSNSGDILAGGGGTNLHKICIENVSDGKVIFWNVADGSVISKTQSIPGGVSYFTFMGNDNNYAVGSLACYRGSPKNGIWLGSIENGLILENLDLLGWPPNQVLYNSRDDTVVVDDGNIKGFDQDNGTLRYQIPGAHNIALNPDRTILVGMAEERKMGFWNPQNGDLLSTLLVEHEYERFLFSSDGKYILGLSLEETTLFAIK